MEIKKEQLISYTLFNKFIDDDKYVLGIQKINSEDKPLLIDILSSDIILDEKFLIYKGTDYLIESLEIILYDEMPYLCESYNQMPICKLPKKVIKYLSLLNMYYYGFTILNNDFFISKIDYNNQIISKYPFKKYSSVKIFKKNNHYYVKKNKKEFKLSDSDFFEKDNQVILAKSNPEFKNYIIVGFSEIKYF